MSDRKNTVPVPRMLMKLAQASQRRKTTSPSVAATPVTPPPAQRAEKENVNVTSKAPSVFTAGASSPSKKGGVITSAPSLGMLRRVAQKAAAASQPVVTPPSGGEYDDYDDYGYDEGGWDEGGFGDDTFDDGVDVGSAPMGKEGFPRIIEEVEPKAIDISSLTLLRGTMNNVAVYGEWGRGTFLPEDGSESLVVVGDAVALLQRGDMVVLFGKYKSTAKWGRQFEVEVATPDSTSIQALKSYLQKNFQGVGPVKANRIVDHYQKEGRIAELRESLVYNPASLSFFDITGSEHPLRDEDGSNIGRVNTLLTLKYGTLGLRVSTIRNLSTTLVTFIESLPTSEIIDLMEDIEKTNHAEKLKPVAAERVSTVPQPIHTPVSPASPSSQSTLVTDEEYVIELVKEYERSVSLIPSNFSITEQLKEFETAEEDLVESSVPGPLRVSDEMLEEFFDDEDDQPCPYDMLLVCRSVLAFNPYAFIGKADRYTFRAADKIAQFEGIDPNDPRRLGALAAYALRLACQTLSHSYVTEDFFLYAIKEIDKRVDCHAAVEIAVKKALVEKDGERYYLSGLLKREKELAYDIATRVTQKTDPLLGRFFSADQIDLLIDRAQEVVKHRKGLDEFTLDPVQRQSVKGLLTSESSLHVIVGGPGRGKTAIVQVVMEVLRLAKRPIDDTLFCAPTGKAAKVLSNQVSDYGVTTTIHSLLKARGDDYFEMNRSNQLATHLLVADEQSMASLNLAHGLLSATPKNAHIILLGDPNQLQSIDSGDFLRSLLKLDGIDKYELIKPHRNKGQILNLVDRVNEGRWVNGVEDMLSVLADGDVQLNLESGVLAPERIPNFINNVVSSCEKYGGIENVGVIVPMRKGDIRTPGWNVTYLNEALRQRLNPDPDGTKKITGSRFYLNDRVIITRNMKQVDYDTVDPYNVNLIDVALGDDVSADKINVINGDTGYIEKAIMGELDGTQQAVGFVVRLDDGKRVVLDSEGKNDLGLAYAITVHAAQGSEYRKVMAVVPSGHANFMHRCLFMTQISRAKEHLEVFGESAVCQRTASRLPPERNCGIYDRSQEWIEKYNQEHNEQLAPEATEPSTPEVYS